MTVRRLLHATRDIAMRAAAERRFHPNEHSRPTIVMVRPDHFGDLLMLIPALRFLAVNARHHRVILMTGPWNEPVASHLFPDIETVSYPFPGFTRSDFAASMLEPYREVAQASQMLRKIAPEMILLMRDDHWWGAWMAREAGIPIRVGYNHPGVTPFLSHPLDLDPGHYVEQNFAMARRALALCGYTPSVERTDPPNQLLDWPTDDALVEVTADLLRMPGDSSPRVIVHPGTGAPVKRWPEERWVHTIDVIVQETGSSVYLTGSPDEFDLCAAIADRSHSNVRNLAGSTSLFELAEIFRQVTLVLGVDSGPLHLATAVHTPSIHLYGPSDPVRYGPWGDPTKHRMVTAGMSCPDCGNLSVPRPAGCGCMTAITSARVAREAIEILNNA
jgi:heptosyltransferase III